MEVKFERIIKRYGDVFAVKDLDLTIVSGGLHFLLGPSGCGKTTTLRMLAGLESPTSGKILFDGKDVTSFAAADRSIGMVFQNYALWPHMTVRKNIEYGLKLRKLPGDETKRRMDEVLDFTQLTNYADRYPGQLSGGQQQRVALARALAIRPSVLLLDEPLSNLDAKLRLEMRDNISRIHKQTGITTVYVTHDQKEALSMGTEVSVMRAGKLVQSDAPRRLYHAPKTPFIAGFIGETNLVDGTFRGRDGGGDPARYRVDTGFGPIFAERLAPEFSPKAGDAVTVSFRPEAMKLDFGGKAAMTMANPLRLVLEHLTYLGESEQFVLKTSDVKILKAQVFNPPEHGLRDGDAVSAWIDPPDVQVLPREEDTSSGT